MNYSIKIKNTAAKELAGIDKPDRHRLATAIDGLAENPWRGTALKGDLNGLRRIRVGNYRVIYEIDDGQVIVLVLKVGHGREIYR